MIMPCFHPMLRFPYDVNPKTGKSKAKIYPRFTAEGREVFGLWYYEPSHEWRPWLDHPPPDSMKGVDFLDKFDVIPCGTCQGCRVDKSREWANRLLLEKQYYPEDQVYFVTLTYDDEHVPRSYYPDPDTGVATPVYTLSDRDLQLYHKRLRKRHVYPLRFFACGEYGPETFRPHYHEILFGLRLSDLVPYGRNELGDMTYTSDFLTSCWSIRKAPVQQGSVTPLSYLDDFCEPLGRVVVAPATWQTFAYVARYTTKKFYGPQAQYYEEFNIQPPFLRMSRMPGIGAQWFADHPDVMDFEYISVSTPTGGRKFRPPHYFDRLYDQENPEHLAEIKEKRKYQAQEAERLKITQTSLSACELLSLSEDQFRSRMKAIKRKDV